MENDDHAAPILIRILATRGAGDDFTLLALKRGKEQAPETIRLLTRLGYAIQWYPVYWHAPFHAYVTVPGSETHPSYAAIQAAADDGRAHEVIAL